MLGAYKCTKAAWNIMREQGYGRIINTSSAAGLFGSFGQVNYSTAKLALHGFTQALAKEGEKKNIRVNTIAPLAASRMLETVMPPDVLKNVNPNLVIPLVAYLTHDSCTETGSVFEVGGGFVAKLRWQRTEVLFPLFRATSSTPPPCPPSASPSTSTRSLTSARPATTLLPATTPSAASWSSGKRPTSDVSNIHSNQTLP